MRISDWSSDVCSSDLVAREEGQHRRAGELLKLDPLDTIVMRLAVAEQKFAISGDPARHIIGPLGEGADPAHAREDVHILFGGLELVERAGRGAVEIEPEEVGGSEHADRIIGIDRNSDACELISI